MDNSDFESESYEVEGSEEIYNKAGNAVCTNPNSRKKKEDRKRGLISSCFSYL